MKKMIIFCMLSIVAFASSKITISVVKPVLNSQPIMSPQKTTKFRKIFIPNVIIWDKEIERKEIMSRKRKT